MNWLTRVTWTVWVVPVVIGGVAPCASAQPAEHSLASLTRAPVARGTPQVSQQPVSKRARNVIIGAIVGGAVGWVFGYGVCEHDAPGGELGCGAIFGAMGAAGGAGIGALLGRTQIAGKFPPPKNGFPSLSPNVGPRLSFQFAWPRN